MAIGKNSAGCELCLPLHDLAVHRLGFGAMRITGAGIWGEPADRGAALATLCKARELEGINWIGGDHQGSLTAKVRSMAKPVPARLDHGRLAFDAPEYGVAPGQAAVLYAGDRVLGGGWIAETEAAALALSAA